ncbi:hypothetical protein SAMN02910369_01235 [Lachnospiraceae bacterium NE2001]|nr:hypothetical protein SAMN02910369_01235 [Lachnospiraceae bacterium NE2001]
MLMKKILNNSGNTMIETIVSFLVLMIVLAALYGMILFSTNLRMRAIDSARVREELYQEAYKKNPDETIVDIYSYEGRSCTSDSKTMFMLKLSEDTKNSNLDIKNAKTRADFEKKINLPNINAIGYVSKDSRIEDENLPTPKLLVFRHYLSEVYPATN